MANEISSVGNLKYIKSDSDAKGSMNVDTQTFLALLVAQMQYQDPLEPQSNSDFVAQLAQMSSMEQMQSMNGSLNTSKAMSYVGKEIYAEVLNSDTGITECYNGVAEGVVMKNGDAYVVLGNYAVCVDDITSVADVEDSSSSTATGAQESAAGEATAESVTE